MKNFSLSTSLNCFDHLSLPGALVILIILGFICYGNTVFYPFIHDDVGFIVNNPDITNWHNLSSHFFEASPLFTKSQVANPYYRPLLDIIYKIQFFIFGTNPFGYHVTNIILHIANSLLVFVILTHLINDKRLALAVAVIFLVHPSQTQAVACISGISNLAFSLLCLGSFILYILSAKKYKGTLSVLTYGLSIILFGTALFVKEQSVVLPFLIVLYELCFSRVSRNSSRNKWIRVAGIFIVLIGYMFLRSNILGGALPSFLQYKGELYLRILSIPRIILTYLSILLFPVNLHFYRSIDMLQTSVFPGLGLLAVIFFIFLVVHRMRKDYFNVLMFSLGWFVITLLPIINIIPMVIEYSFLWTPEHFLYFPMLGFYLFICLIVKHHWCLIFKKYGNRTIGAVFFAVCLIFISMTIKQNTYYRGEIPLFKRALHYEKNLGRLHLMLANAYYSEGDFDRAVSEYHLALSIMREYASKAKVVSAKRLYIDFIREIDRGIARCQKAKTEKSVLK